MAFIYPVNAPVSQPFGVNPNSFQPQGHYGIDFACAIGTDIRAIGDGVIRWADWNQNLGANPWMIIPGATGSGIFVVIDHGNGYVSLYCHLDSTPLNIGQRVTAGSVIGKSGTTGNSTGPHLHLEVVLMNNINGYRYGRIDPASVMSGYQTVGSVTLQANQRKVGGSNLNQRSEAKTSAPVVRVVPANTIETFTGYVLGELVDSGGVRSNIWYKDNQGYVWAGGFTEQSGKGLTDLTPAPALAPNQRKVGPSNVNQRKEASTGAAVVRTITGGTIETFTGYVIGETVNLGGVSSNIWYKDSQGYVWAGGFMTQSTNGLPNQSPSLLPNQRRVGGSGAFHRASASTSAAVVRNIAPNSVESFSGYVIGEAVNVGGVSSNIWYKDNQGYVWAGMFESQSTEGLPNQTPVPNPSPVPVPVPTPEVTSGKTVVPEGVRLRTQPSTSSSIIGVLEGGAKVKPVAYIEAESVSGSNVWFALEAGYIHSSGVTDASVRGLSKQSAPTTPPVDEEPPYVFTPDFDFVEYKPANTWNMQNGNFPAKPEKIVLHQFDAKALKPSIAGVISHFQNPRPGSPSSAHFVVSGKRIVQMVSLKDRAFHAGTVGNDYIGIEVDPQEDADTVASVKKLILALNKKYGKVFAYTKHRDVPGNATLCGADITLEKYAVDETTPVPTPPDPKPETPPTQTEPTKEQIQFVLDYLLRVHSK